MLSPSTELSLEAAEDEKSRTSLIPPEWWAWSEEGQPEPPALPMLPELPEVPMEMPPRPELSSEAVLRYPRGFPLGVGPGCYPS